MMDHFEKPMDPAQQAQVGPPEGQSMAQHFGLAYISNGPAISEILAKPSRSPSWGHRCGLFFAGSVPFSGEFQVGSRKPKRKPKIVGLAISME